MAKEIEHRQDTGDALQEIMDACLPATGISLKLAFAWDDPQTRKHTPWMDSLPIIGASYQSNRYS